MLEFTIKSRKLQKTVTFCRPIDFHIYVDLNGQEGSQGWILLKNGYSKFDFPFEDCLGVYGDDDDDRPIDDIGDVQREFNRICLKWWRMYIKDPDGFF